MPVNPCSSVSMPERPWIHPNVFNPTLFFGAEFLAEELISIVSEYQDQPVKLLEIGTGAGYLSILAILNGVSHATSTDINKNALENANENAVKHGVVDKITFKYSDVFSALDVNDKFDIIFWNYPFGHMNRPIEQLDMLEQALIDPFLSMS